MATLPQYISQDPDVLKSQLAAKYKDITGKDLFPAQIESLQFDAAAYVMSLFLAKANAAIRSQLVNYSAAPMLDELANNVGVTRLPAQPATVIVAFELDPAHMGTTIPGGYTVATPDSKLNFELPEDLYIAPGVTSSANVTLICQTDGTIGNGYVNDTNMNITDPLPFLVNCITVNVSQGGAEAETDDQLRARIKISYERPSTAGSVNAFKYWVYTFNPSIVDVNVYKPTTGTVEICCLLKGGIIPDETFFTNLQNYLLSDQIMPVGPILSLRAPTDFPVDCNILFTLKTGGDITEATTRITKVANEYFDLLKNNLGMQFVANEMVALAMTCYDKIQDVTVSLGNTEIDQNEFITLTSLFVGLNVA